MMMLHLVPIFVVIVNIEGFENGCLYCAIRVHYNHGYRIQLKGGIKPMMIMIKRIIRDSTRVAMR
jgi:hypothetical protein